ncbi:MAG: GGDEF domain-containing protein [Xanthobacteraceae bacterium]|nr:GGDEF domain-containing protein [Xanthobacteraceae bacterium]
MSQPGPVVVIADDEHPALTRDLTESRLFPLVETSWSDAAEAVSRVRPSCVIVCGPYDRIALQTLSTTVASLQPYVPLIAVDPAGDLPLEALPFRSERNIAGRFKARLNAALRVRTLHATVLRRLQSAQLSRFQLPEGDPLSDSTVLLVGRGGSFPALSVALGERMGIVGALSIEAAASHLNTRAVDGIVIGDGFSPRVIDAFLMVLSEDARFRNLPVIQTAGSVAHVKYDLPNLESVHGPLESLVSHALPLIRQSALEARLNRALQSLDAGGILDPRTGLLTQAAFLRDLADAIDHALADSSGLSVALFTLATQSDRSRFDAARIMGRLTRRMDFATLRDDGSIIVVFSGTDVRDARMIGRRISSVLRQTGVSDKPNGKLSNDVAITSVLPGDDSSTIISRLRQQDQRAAS